MRLVTITRFMLTGLLTGSCLVFAVAQKVDLDKFSFDVSYLQLPRRYMAPNQRTYGLKITASAAVHAVYPESEIYDKINLSGFQKVEANPAVGLHLNFDNVRFEKTEMQTRTVENKDKEGKVTSRSYYYTLVATYSAGGGYRVYGPKDEKSSDDKLKDTKPNRFLQTDTGLDKSADFANQTVVRSGSFANQLTYSTKEYNASVDASRYFEQNQSAIRTELISDYVTKAIDEVNTAANREYGFVPVQTRDHLWILDSKTHPEYEIQQEAIKAVKELMKTMSATKPLTTLAQNLKPVMEYFETLKTKYAGDDKPNRKMRYSAYYNLATLYYLLDQPASVITEANGLIKNDYDTSDGKKYLRLAEELQKDLGNQKMSSRHMDR